MKPALALLLAVATALPLASPGTAFHGETCSADGATPAVQVGDTYAVAGVATPANGFVNQNPPGTPIKFTMLLEAGEHSAVIQQTGDVDFVFCIPGALLNRHLCSMGNVMPMPESCLLGISWSGTVIVLAADTTVVLYAIYCSGTFCGYPTDIPAAPFAGVVV